MKMLLLIMLLILVTPVMVFAAEVAVPWYRDWAIILAMLLGLSEVIGMSPLKDNSIFQFIWGLLKKIVPKKQL